MRFYGTFNQAGELAPLAGESALALRALATRPILPNVRPYIHKYGGFLGMFDSRGVNDRPFYGRTQYGGNLPGDQQPMLLVPDPWNDPNRGQP